MRHGLHFSVIQKECGFQQGFPITGGAGADDSCFLRKLFINLTDGADGGFERAAVVAAVERVEKAPLLVHQSDLGRGAPGVDSQITVSFVGGELPSPDMVPGMPLLESLILCFRGEKRLHALHLKFHFDIGRELARHLIHGIKNVFLCV